MNKEEEDEEVEEYEEVDRLKKIISYMGWKRITIKESKPKW